MPSFICARISRTFSMGNPAITGALPGILKRYHIFSSKMSVFMWKPVPWRVFSLAFCEG